MRSHDDELPLEELLELLDELELLLEVVSAVVQRCSATCTQTSCSVCAESNCAACAHVVKAPIEQMDSPQPHTSSVKVPRMRKPQ